MQPLKVNIPEKGILAIFDHARNDGIPKIPDAVKRRLLELLGATVRFAWLDGTNGIYHYKDRYNSNTAPSPGLGEESLEYINLIRQDRTAGDWEKIAERVRRANFILLAGGHAMNHRRFLEGSPVWDAILEVLAGGGVLAAGDGGAVVLGEEGWVHYSYLGVDGFGLVQDSCIIPQSGRHPTHNRKGMEDDDEEDWELEGLTLVEIELNTALVCHGGNLQVAGEGRVILQPGWKAIERLLPKGTKFAWKNKKYRRKASNRINPFPEIEVLVQTPIPSLALPAHKSRR